jgi:RNA polymerase sigma-70 factor (ECF subfamily)
MYRVAINTAITHFKKDAKNRKKSDIGKELYLLADETYDFEKEEQLNLLHEAINQLTGIEKSIILLFLEDKSYEEISDITGISQNYVRVKMNRIKKKLEYFVKSRERN